MSESAFAALVLTLYPEMFPGPLGLSLSGKALAEKRWSLEVMSIRDFATDKHRTVDDTPYGGGAGMVMKPDVVDNALKAAKAKMPGGKLIYFTPRGTPLTQKLVNSLVKEQLILLCGRFEAVDERVLDAHQPLEISLGDFVLAGGEIPAYALLEACVRLLPGVVGDAESLAQESFGLCAEYAGLLEYPHYTRPPIWNERAVPEVLLSGNHAEIEAWRRRQAEETTKARRKDLWDAYQQKRAT